MFSYSIKSLFLLMIEFLKLFIKKMENLIKEHMNQTLNTNVIVPQIVYI